MKLRFTKMHGCGNDYIYLNCFDSQPADPVALSVRLSNRHFGVGGDGIVLICPSEVADAKMRMFNADGSEGEMCGNAARCVAKYLYHTHLVRKEQMLLETISGVKQISLLAKNGVATQISVAMGQPVFEPAKVPVLLPGDRVLARRVEVGGQVFNISCVSMGNPHCVVYTRHLETLKLETLGPLFENSPLFPQRVNAGFVQVCGRQKLKARIWERGSGETFACGTGACAAAVLSVKNGFCDARAPIEVQLKGGSLWVDVTSHGVTLTGGASFVFSGEIQV